MTKDEIESFITQFPIYQYQFLTPDEIEYNDRVRMICKKECPRYGTSWSCPPAVTGPFRQGLGLPVRSRPRRPG